MGRSGPDGSGRQGSGLKAKEINNMKHPGGRYGPRMEGRRQKAQEMAEYRAGLSDQEQINRLDKRLGKGQGAQKERARLNARIKGKE